MAVYLRDTAFDPRAELATHESGLAAGAAGARVDFTGFMRDSNAGQRVHSLHLEHYAGMTEQFLQRVCDEAGSKWPLLDMLIVHRVGTILPGEPIVLVSVWSVHRADAFDACRYLITALKHEAPLWKRESRDDGEHWLQENTRDDDAGYVES